MPPGPAPKHPSVRQRRNKPKADFRSLPATGYTGETPPWPLEADVKMTAELDYTQDRVAQLQAQLEATTDGRRRPRIQRELDKHAMQATMLQMQLERAKDSEQALWAKLWHSPQAVVWAESHTEHEVALYVRWSVRAEQGDMKAATEARQLSDRYGINPLALMRMRAEIEQADAAEERGRRRRSGSPADGKRKPPDDPRRGLHVVGG